ncbi:MAG: hypothetical protein K0S31_669 [Sphingobacterium multivorum]|jgi:hypothetical protein|nr:hypothetical protein [Sphingobacterium multivorum]
MRKTSLDIIQLSLQESIRLTKIEGFSISFEQLIREINTENEENAIYDDKIYQLYKSVGSANIFCEKCEEYKEHFKLLSQFLLVNDIYRNHSQKFATLDSISDILRTQEIHNQILNPWRDGFLAVIHQEHFVGNTWSNLALSSTYDWDEIQMLDESLPYCSVHLEDILDYLRSITTHHPNDMGVHSIGKNVVLTISGSGELQSEIEKNIDSILSLGSNRKFLPSFLKGVINEDKQKFLSSLGLYPEAYPQYCNEFLWALGAACPPDESCKNSYKLVLDIKLKDEKISIREFIQLATRYQFKTDDVIKLAMNISKTASTTEELNCLTEFLTTNIIDNQSEWFRTISSQVIQANNEQISSQLSHLIYRIKENNLELSYSLLTIRFEKLGSKNFLKTFWNDLIRNDIDLFQKHLTYWFSTENYLTHSALLKLTSLHEIHPSYFRLSEELLTQMTSSEKLYIALKIAGYIYSMEHLQSLIISVTNCIRKDEIELLDNIYDIFYSYVIYNYRSTLDLIKEEQKKDNLPSHLKAFYNQLEKAYDVYFYNLSLVKDYSELSHNQLLSRHLQYYKQQEFSDQLKKSNRNSFLDSIKNTPVHSKKWAIRRAHEKIHQVSPLGTFGVNIEFPSGEILNPISQESKRRTYQKITKNEININ